MGAGGDNGDLMAQLEWDLDETDIGEDSEEDENETETEHWLPPAGDFMFPASYTQMDERERLSYLPPWATFLERHLAKYITAFLLVFMAVLDHVLMWAPRRETLKTLWANEDHSGVLFFAYMDVVVLCLAFPIFFLLTTAARLCNGGYPFHRPSIKYQMDSHGLDLSAIIFLSTSTGFLLVGSILSLTIASLLTTVGRQTAILFGFSFVAQILSFVFLREALTPSKAVALGVYYTGGLLSCEFADVDSTTGVQGGSVIGDLFALMGALGMVLLTVAFKYQVPDMNQYMTHMLLSAVAVATAVCLFPLILVVTAVQGTHSALESPEVRFGEDVLLSSLLFGVILWLLAETVTFGAPTFAILALLCSRPISWVFLVHPTHGLDVVGFVGMILCMMALGLYTADLEERVPAMNGWKIFYKPAASPEEDEAPAFLEDDEEESLMFHAL